MTSTTTSTGPELLDERTLGGIAVHLLALATGFVGALVVYAVSDHEYTRANARHALNWHVTVFVVSVLGFLAFFLGADDLSVRGEAVEWSLLPPPIDTAFAVVGALLLLLAGISWVLTFVFALVATVKAIFGSAWSYPGAVDVVGRYR